MFLSGKTKEGSLHGEDRASRARKINNRPKSDNRRRARLRVEGLEDRQLLSWGSVPPAHRLRGVPASGVRLPGSDRVSS